MVVGNNPEEIIKKYSGGYKVEPYVKYKYLDAKKYQNAAIKVLTNILKNSDTIGIDEPIKNSLEERLKVLNSLTPFEYYRELTASMYYDEEGNALSEENPNKKYNTCRIGRNFSLPLKLKDGTETYSALVKDVDWESMNNANREVYSITWELVVDKREPQNDQEKTIASVMGDKLAYFSRFKSKEDYVSYNTLYWCYAFLDENAWVDVDDTKNETEWIKEFYPRFIEKLNPNDRITIYECSVKND